jgi:hypothetical protein
MAIRAMVAEGCFVLMSLTVFSACSAEPRSDARPSGTLKFEDHLPLESKGRRPAGTRDDPFIGIGILKSVIPFANEGLLRIDVAHRAIPYFKNAMDMGVYVPPEVVQGANEGDFVRLHYAKLTENTRAAIEFEKALKVGLEKATWRRPHVWFGFELYKITAIPDAEYRRDHESFGRASAASASAAQK